MNDTLNGPSALQLDAYTSVEKAITELDERAKVYENNAPIHEKEGNHEQAAFAKSAGESCREAIDALRAHASDAGSMGWAIRMLRAGFPVRRAGWNGKGMFLVKAGGYRVKRENVKANGPITESFLAAQGLETLDIQPHIDMWTAQKNYVPGWLASQADIFALDWELAT